MRPRFTRSCPTPDDRSTSRLRGSERPRRLDLHARRRIDARERTVVAAIPVTTVERTLVDLAAVVPGHRLRKALAEAERLRAVHLPDLLRALDGTRGRNGSGHAALTSALAELRRHGPQQTRSDAEDLLLDLVIEHGLARPRMNRVIEGAEFDAVWPAQRVAVEVDGGAFHWTARRQERDAEKAAALEAEGWRVLRFDWCDVTVPARRARVADALRAAGVPGT